MFVFDRTTSEPHRETERAVGADITFYFSSYSHAKAQMLPSFLLLQLVYHFQQMYVQKISNSFFAYREIKDSSSHLSASQWHSYLKNPCKLSQKILAYTLAKRHVLITGICRLQLHHLCLQDINVRYLPYDKGVSKCSYTDMECSWNHFFCTKSKM